MDKKKLFSINLLSFFSFILIFYLLLPLKTFPSTPPDHYFSKGENFQAVGDFEKSIHFFKKSLQLSRKLGDKKKQGQSLLKLGLIYWNTGELDESRDYYLKCLSLAQKNYFKELEKTAETALKIHEFYKQGKNYRSSGKLEKSIHSFNQAVTLAQKISSPAHKLKCLRQMSVSYWMSGDLEQFYNLNQKGLRLARSLHHLKEEGRCLNNMGLFHWKLDNYAQALDCYNKALNIAIQLQNKQEQSICLSNMGLIYKNIGDYENALEYTQRALAIDKKLGNELYISIDLNNIGEIYRLKGLLNQKENYFYEALNNYKKSLVIARKNNNKKIEVKVLNNMGSLHSHLKDYFKAMDYFQEGYRIAQEIEDVESKGMLLNNMGIVQYNLGNYQKSTRYYQEAIKLAREIKSGKILWEAYLEMANSYKKQGKYQQALESYQDSIDIIENIRSGIELENYKALFLGTDKRIQAYYNLIDLLVYLHKSHPEKDYARQAFYYLEKARARAFLDQLQLSKIDVSGEISLKLQNQEKELIKDISNLYAKLLVAEASPEDKKKIRGLLQEKENKLEALKRKIRMENPAYADLKYPRVITLTQAQKLLDNKTAFFAYCLREEKSYGFAVTKNKLQIFTLPPQEDIQKLVVEYKKIITDKDNYNFQPGFKLFRLLVAPGLKKQIENIIFIPDHILHSLPFETLLTQQNKPEWLVKKYKISYAPSVSSLREIISRKKANGIPRKKNLLAVGDPYLGSIGKENNGNHDSFLNYYSHNTFNLYRLQYSGVEVLKIGSLFTKEKKDILQRKQASKKSLENTDLEDYKIIHFATHSLVDDQKPSRSSIVLSVNKQNKRETFLQMREIYNLHLNADLVTLSACQTGLGELIRGEGIEGLNRAFFYAGSSALLMSLWAVNDQATYQLMERFYIHVHSSKSIRSALRKAKLEMINSRVLSHPYYWAGFIVSGKADQVIFPSSYLPWVIPTVVLFLLGGILIFIRRKKLFSGLTRTGSSWLKQHRERSTTNKRQ